MDPGAAVGEKLARIYLRETQGEALKKRLSAEGWKSLLQTKLACSVLAVVSLDFRKASLERELSVGLEAVFDIRPSPDFAFVAYTLERKEYCELWAVPTDASSPAMLMNGFAAAYPDWTADSRSLVYECASGTQQPGKGSVTLGVIARQDLRNGRGRLVAAGEAQELAGVLFNVFARVRCLKDGRILFNAVEATLPASASELRELRSRFCVLDSARYSTVLRPVSLVEYRKLPASLSYFEVSPDESRILFAGGLIGYCGLCLLIFAEGSYSATLCFAPRSQPVRVDLPVFSSAWFPSREPALFPSRLPRRSRRLRRIAAFRPIVLAAWTP